MREEEEDVEEGADAADLELMVCVKEEEGGVEGEEEEDEEERSEEDDAGRVG